MTLDKIRILKHAPCLVFAAILGIQLFVPPSVGLANNGDFPKVMGLFDLGGPRGDEYGYVDWVYRFDPVYHWQSGFYSSETFIAAAPIGLSHALSKSGSFDLRWMGLVHGLLFLLAVYLMEDLLNPAEGWRWYVLWAFILIAFGDVMYVSYFSSVYMDAASYVFLMLSVVLFLRAAAWRRKSDAIGLVICVALMLLSKSQHAILGLWIAPLFAVFGRSLWPGKARLFAIVSTTIVCAAALAGLELVPLDYAAHEYYSVIFWQVLPHSKNVNADLASLGLDESYAKFVGTHAFSPGSGFRDPSFADAFKRRTSFSRLGWYFVTHPREAYLTLDSALGEGGRQRPVMANFDRSRGSPPFTESRSFALWSDTKRALFHEHGVRYGIGYALVIGFACAMAISRRNALPAVLVAGVVAIAGMGVTEVLIASLADAVDVTRHYFIAGALFDLELLIVLVLAYPTREPVAVVPRPNIGLFRLVFCTAAVFVTGFALLAWHVTQDGIGAAYTDPVLKIRAVDEAPYVNAAMRMAHGGDWLTPNAFGRLFFQNPPLVYWLSALSIKSFGLSLFAIRLPGLLFGALGGAAVFLWCAKYRSILSGTLAAAMLLSCPVYLTMSHLVDINILTAAFTALAMTMTALDPHMERRSTWICTGALTGAAILCKSVAGIVPLVALAAYWTVVPSRLRPPFARLAASAIVAVLVAAPWHIYQLVTHPKWFWTEYVDMLIISIGMHPERNGLFNQPQSFYLQRLLQLDPILTLYAIVGIAGAIWMVRSLERLPELLALCWTVVTILALAAFQAKYLTYVVTLLPPLCVLGGLGVPRRALLPAALLLIVKAPVVSPQLEGARAMRAYYALGRDTELIAANTDDDLYSATLPLPHVRYAAVDPSHTLVTGKPYYGTLGIVLTTDEFVALPVVQPTYEKQLQEWGENSAEPIGTAIMLAAPGDLITVVRTHPLSDFYVPASWSQIIAQAEPTHSVLYYSADRVFLLSRGVSSRSKPLAPIPTPW